MEMNLSGLRQSVVGVGSKLERGPERLMTLGVGHVALFIVRNLNKNTSVSHGRKSAERMKE